MTTDEPRPTTREQRTVFGEVAGTYDDVRPGYPPEILTRILAHLGRTPARVLESGAGTGKATALLRTLDVPVTCVEPDPEMAAVLTGRYADDHLVSVVVSGFEDYTPAAPVDLLASAQAWHWVDPARRAGLAHAALAPGGVLAVFGHHYGFADPELSEALNAVYLRLAPEIAHREGFPEHYTPFAPGELAAFTDLDRQQVERVVPFPTERYLRLLSTFSNHRLLAPERRERLHAALAEVIDGHGGVLDHRLTTTLWLARR
ncbi:class I SAM-dependent methyltransferase [Longispora urticae]